MVEAVKFQLDSGKLAKLYKANDAARCILDYLAERRRNRGDSNIDQILQALGREGHDVTRNDAIAAMREIAQTGAGEFFAGRRGYKTRIVWHVEPNSLGKLATGEAAEPAPVPEAQRAEPEPVADNSSETFEHVYQLRRDCRIMVELPRDFTAAEAERLASFLRTLPLEG